MMDVLLRVWDGEGYADLRGRFPAECTVLDALEILRARSEAAGRDAKGPAMADRVPPYRHSCHHGSCGTCGARINGLESLMCLTRFEDLSAPRSRAPGGPVQDPAFGPEGELLVSLEPLRGATVLAGIAARPVAALAGIPSEYSYLRPSDGADRAPLPGDPTRSAVTGGSERAPDGADTSAASLRSDAASIPARVRFEACIECGLCSSACPVTAPFSGPAALSAINREREKHPQSAERMLDLAARPDGSGACERNLACSRVCPQAVYPGKHIQLLRNALAAKRR